MFARDVAEGPLRDMPNYASFEDATRSNQIWVELETLDPRLVAPIRVGCARVGAGGLYAGAVGDRSGDAGSHDLSIELSARPCFLRS